MSKDNNPKELEIFALATDPIYIGTGGYTIGCVDNTIVRDPITNIPKIPGSSLAGTWRYYTVLEIISNWKKLIDKLSSKKEELKEKLKELIDSFDWIDGESKNKIKNKIDSLNFDDIDLSTPRNFIVNIIFIIGLKFENHDSKEIKSKKYEKQRELFEIILNQLKEGENKDYFSFEGNRFLQITCAGQDNVPQEELSNAPFATDRDGKTGHCGHCIVCKGFGFSKKDISWQGQIFFSDLNIIFFPVFTIRGTKWITTRKAIEEIELKDIENTEEQQNRNSENLYFVFEKLAEDETDGHINLGWLYLPYKFENNENLKNKIQKILKNLQFQVNLSLKDIIVVPEDIFSHIVNSNLEVRTSVSIDPITGAAKEGALFTSEAIPRGTIFYGNIRIFDKKVFEEFESKLKPLPDKDELCNALKDSRHYYESLGIGGMTTRGFGRLEIESPDWDKEG